MSQIEVSRNFSESVIQGLYFVDEEFEIDGFTFRQGQNVNLHVQGKSVIICEVVNGYNIFLEEKYFSKLTIIK